MIDMRAEARLIADGMVGAGSAIGKGIGSGIRDGLTAIAEAMKENKA